jgi:hypothetical protein
MKRSPKRRFANHEKELSCGVPIGHKKTDRSAPVEVAEVRRRRLRSVVEP